MLFGLSEVCVAGDFTFLTEIMHGHNLLMHGNRILTHCHVLLGCRNKIIKSWPHIVFVSELSVYMCVDEDIIYNEKRFSVS